MGTITKLENTFSVLCLFAIRAANIPSNEKVSEDTSTNTNRKGVICMPGERMLPIAMITVQLRSPLRIPTSDFPKTTDDVFIGHNSNSSKLE